MSGIQTFIFMERIIQATINALGFLENGVYYPEPDCFGMLSGKEFFWILPFYQFFFVRFYETRKSFF